MKKRALTGISFVALLGAFAMAGPVALAQEQKPQDAAKEAPKAEDKPEEKKNPVVAAAEEFTKGFSDVDRRHFNILYGNYNLVKVVETVKGDVALAVGKCGEANADMKQALDDRYAKWGDAIKPVMTEAEANINNMVFAQEYAKPKEIRKFFKLIDKARADKEKEVEKVPVTSKEACEYLLKTMDSTQENMIKLLRATLVSLPQAMQQEEEWEKKQKAAEKADQKAPAEAAPKSAGEENPAEKSQSATPEPAASE